MLSCLCAAPSLADANSRRIEGWEVERGVEPPGYAVTDPVSTNLNVDSVVLACELAGDGKVLQLQIYLSTDGPLSPTGVAPRLLKDDPSAEIVIDGRAFPVEILFADVHAVLADETKGMFPLLSKPLLDAMATGKTMVLRFDLVAERAGHPRAFDGEVVIALQAGAGGAAVAAVRRCAEAETRPASMAYAQP
jgi:hypothetical protein